MCPWAESGKAASRLSLWELSRLGSPRGDERQSCLLRKVVWLILEGQQAKLLGPPAFPRPPQTRSVRAEREHNYLLCLGISLRWLKPLYSGARHQSQDAVESFEILVMTEEDALPFLLVSTGNEFPWAPSLPHPLTQEPERLRILLVPGE